MSGEHNIPRLLKEYYPLLAVLIGAILISLPMGPYRTLDTQLELDTAQGVLTWGYPYYNATGNIFNEPPLGFYTEAAYFHFVGFSEENGAALITAFGLACIVLVYLLGAELYSKSVGVFAAAFFALAPWELILSRSFLIDTQCLLLSLAYLYIGILAIRRGSVKLAAVSGVFFALALLTKLFAVFMLVPLLLIYLYHRPKNPKRVLSQLTAFSLPAFLGNLLWYQGILGFDLLYFFKHNDFKDLNFPDIAVTPLFASNFLINYGLGVFFFAVALVSLGVGLMFWRRFDNRLMLFDAICFLSIFFIVGLVVYLAVFVNLKAPYTSAVKYIYQALPFFCLAAASLVAKSSTLLKSAVSAEKFKKASLYAVSILGLAVVLVALVSNMDAARQLATSSYMVFRVQPDLDYGYAFHVHSPPTLSSPILWVQFFGFLVVLSGLFWTGKHLLVEFVTGGFASMRRWIDAKQAARTS
jgi:4-amino-4-deoxy-L-arabinose transferase-like glycosyltransferase